MPSTPMLTEAACPIPLAPPLCPFRREDAAAVARLNNAASGGLHLHRWQEKAGAEGDPWEIGRLRQIGRMEAGQIMIVVDRGEGVEAVLLGNPIGLEPLELPEAGLYLSVLELQNLVLGSWYLNDVATVERARRQGLARRLLDTAEAIARAGGHDLICLVVSDANAPARALYAADGYTEMARRPIFKGGWDGPGDDWILLTKPL
jgi:ribosomal protein S18 acetylase RimI-like enzyme